MPTALKIMLTSLIVGMIAFKGAGSGRLTEREKDGGYYFFAVVLTLSLFTIVGSVLWLIWSS